MSAMSDLRAAVARADEVLGCAGTCRFKTPMGQTTNGRCDCLEQPHATMVFAALYKAVKALVATEEPRERWVDAEGVTRLPKAMREELRVGNGAHIWFLRGPERWEAWRESELSDLFGGEAIHEEVERRASAPGFAGAAQSELLAECGLKCGCRMCLRAANVLPSWMIVCPQCSNKRCPRATSHDNACSGSNEPGQDGSRYK